MAFTWSTGTLTPTDEIKAAHLTEVQSNVDTAAGITPCTGDKTTHYSGHCTADLITHLSGVLAAHYVSDFDTHNAGVLGAHYVTYDVNQHTTYKATHYGTYVSTAYTSLLSNYHYAHKGVYNASYWSSNQGVCCK